MGFFIPEKDLAQTQQEMKRREELLKKQQHSDFPFPKSEETSPAQASHLKSGKSRGPHI